METLEIALVVFLAVAIIICATYLFFDYRSRKKHAAKMLKEAKKRRVATERIEENLAEIIYLACRAGSETAKKEKLPTE